MQTTAGIRAATLLPALKYPLRPTSSTGGRVATAFRAAVEDRGGNPLVELRAATLAFAAMLGAEGVSPEKVLVSLKAALQTTGRRFSLAQACCPDHVAETPEYRMYVRVFTWYLEGYFGRTRTPRVTRALTTFSNEEVL